MLTLLSLLALTPPAFPVSAQTLPQSGRLSVIGEVVWTEPSLPFNSPFATGVVVSGALGVDLSTAPTQVGAQGLAYDTLPGVNRIDAGFGWLLSSAVTSTLTPLTIVNGVMGQPDSISFEQSLQLTSGLPPGDSRVVLSVIDAQGDAWSSPEIGLLPTRIEASLALGLTATISVIDVSDQLLALIEVDALELDLSGEAGCPGFPNSSGLPGRLLGIGSRAVTDNSFTLSADRLPANTFGFFLVAPSNGFVLNPGGFLGFLCVSGPVGRFVGPGEVQNSGPGGVLSLALDLTNLPTPLGSESIAPGETRYFQAWHRDNPSLPLGFPTNFSSSLAVTFK
ncbi:hypothetical protein Poly30_48140 [Planctomycetes bacterium Poly30]|uniref:Uncharacterized protein n=1 Tax=Saltatorellus ferox TaxID=2528018 RepID=A0A518EYV2_9BACT|nr:hypothetical protein Poly30_48140 [Planctomycetes bacterium Poly30]